MAPRFPTPDEREKRARLTELLADQLVFVHLDARAEGVCVPEHLQDEAALVLKLSHRFGLETFDVGPVDVVAGLSFGGTRFRCVLPYTAIFAFSTDEQPFVAFYPDAAPAEVRAALEVAIRPAPEIERSAAPPEPETETDDDPPKGPPTLRLVK